MKRLGWIALLLAVAGCLAHAAAVYPGLPETVPSHFSLSGTPSDTAGKGTLLTVYAVATLLVALPVALFAVLAGRMRPEGFNLPHRDYWMTPQRAAATRDFLSAQLLWIGVATLALLFWVFRQSFRVAHGEIENAPHLLPTLAVYGLFVAGWVVACYVRFRRLPADVRAS